MRCTFCGCFEDKVIDSRQNDDGTSIRRRRECTKCGRRFTTYEVIEMTPILVIKSNGARQPFNSNKIKAGMIKACEKRPVPAEKIDEAVSDIEKQIYNTMKMEISASEIGEMVMNKLKEMDNVAYIRFASVYIDFTDATSFTEFVATLEEKGKGGK